VIARETLLESVVFGCAEERFVKTPELGNKKMIEAALLGAIEVPGPT
jgi:hypothetical protein